jgi:hypothetical protein
MTTNRDDLEGQRFVRADGTMWREVSDGLVVLGPTADRPTHVAGTAARGWAHFDRLTTFDVVVGRLVATYGVDEAVARRDLSEIVDALVREGALERVTSS